MQQHEWLADSVHTCQQDPEQLPGAPRWSSKGSNTEHYCSQLIFTDSDGMPFWHCCFQGMIVRPEFGGIQPLLQTLEVAEYGLCFPLWAGLLQNCPESWFNCWPDLFWLHLQVPARFYKIYKYVPPMWTPCSKAQRMPVQRQLSWMLVLSEPANSSQYGCFGQLQMLRSRVWDWACPIRAINPTFTKQGRNAIVPVWCLGTFEQNVCLLISPVRISKQTIQSPWKIPFYPFLRSWPVK